MPALVPLESIITVRGGKRVSIPVGKSFDFTTAETTHLLATGVARLANSADQKGDPDAMPLGSSVIAATRKRSADPADIARQIGDSIAAALAPKEAPAKGGSGKKAAAVEGAAAEANKDEDL